MTLETPLYHSDIFDYHREIGKPASEQQSEVFWKERGELVANVFDRIQAHVYNQFGGNFPPIQYSENQWELVVIPPEIGRDVAIGTYDPRNKRYIISINSFERDEVVALKVACAVIEQELDLVPVGDVNNPILNMVREAVVMDYAQRALYDELPYLVDEPNKPILGGDLVKLLVNTSQNIFITNREGTYKNPDGVRESLYYAIFHNHPEQVIALFEETYGDGIIDLSNAIERWLQAYMRVDFDLANKVTPYVLESLNIPKIRASIEESLSVRQDRLKRQLMVNGEIITFDFTPEGGRFPLRDWFDGFGITSGFIDYIDAFQKGITTLSDD